MKYVVFPHLSLAIGLCLLLGVSGGCARSAPIGIQALSPAAQSKDDPFVLGEAFQSASAEFGVPVEVLQATAYVETQWSAVSPEAHVEGEDDHHLHVFGVMGL